MGKKKPSPPQCQFKYKSLYSLAVLQVGSDSAGLFGKKKT